MKSIFQSALLAMLLLLSLITYSQNKVDSVYTLEGLKRSTSFAAMTFGGDVLMLSGGTIAFDGKSESLNPQFMPRLTIGGLHFWNHADFYVTFPLGFGLGKTPASASTYKQIESVETGARIYPWSVKPNKWAPFVGISFQPLLFTYEIKDNQSKYGGAVYERFITPIQLGITYATQSSLFSLSARYNWKNNFDYHINEVETTATQINPINFSLAFLKTLDTDKSLATPGVAESLHRNYLELDKIGALSSWYWAIGPSTALQMSKSPYYKKFIPFLYNDMTNSFIIPEAAIGRYFHKAGMNVNAAFRYMWWKQTAFDTEVKTNRASVALEAYKFLFDYHGFIPFIGPSVNVDRLRYTENGNSTTQNKLRLGVVFGWDIRVMKSGSSLLRTNLRYLPGHHLSVKGEKVMFDHLEFNFIQYVRFFGRIQKVKKHHQNLD